MKLLNQSLKYLSISILLIVSMWAVVFYLNLIHEIKGSIDDGLENYKNIIVENAQKDPSVLTKNQFDETFYSIRTIERAYALSAKDVYKDAVIDIPDPDSGDPDKEPARMLTTTFEIDGQYYELKVANSMVEEDELIDKLFWNVVWLYVILISGIIIINNIVLRKLWKPFYNFLDQLKNYRLGSSKNLPAVKTKTKEFTDMQMAVNTLLQHSIAAFEQQKEFIGNASHELQTPLAMVTNKLELLLENEDLSGTHAEKLAEIYQIIEKLVRLNKSLLLLSKIDNKQFFDNRSISVNEVVQKTIDDLFDITTFKEIQITFSEQEELHIQMDLTLANIIVANLLKNAIFHNIKNGRIEILIERQNLKVCNTGENTPLEADKMFHRFQKSGAKTNGTGLGLAIVKAITDLYGIPVSYNFGDGMHCFEVRFTAVSVIK